MAGAVLETVRVPGCTANVTGPTADELTFADVDASSENSEAAPRILRALARRMFLV